MSMIALNRIHIVLLAAACCAFGAGRRATAYSASQSSQSRDSQAATSAPIKDGGPRLDATEAATGADEAAIQSQINSIYRGFYNSYRLGAGDVIAIHVDKHPDDSVERVVVSPVGQVYFPLLGNVSVAGKTMEELQDFFIPAVSEYIKEPRVTLSLIEANSAKIGVLGDVRNPGVVIMSRPMRVLEALTAVGGITDLGSSTNVAVLRHYDDGRVQIVNVNVKRVLQGKAGSEENLYLASGDTIIVHGNKLKALGKISSVVGLTSFFNFLSAGKL